MSDRGPNVVDDPGEAPSHGEGKSAALSLGTARPPGSAGYVDAATS